MRPRNADANGLVRLDPYQSGVDWLENIYVHQDHADFKFDNDSIVKASEKSDYDLLKSKIFNFYKLHRFFYI